MRFNSEMFTPEEQARDYLLGQGIARPGQRVVVTAGVPFHAAGGTNLMRVEVL